MLGRRGTRDVPDYVQECRIRLFIVPAKATIATVKTAAATLSEKIFSQNNFSFSYKIIFFFVLKTKILFRSCLHLSIIFTSRSLTCQSAPLLLGLLHKPLDILSRINTILTNFYQFFYL